MKSLKVGMLGAGFMGRTHAQRLAKQPGVTVDCVCAAVMDESRKLSQDVTAGQAACYDSFDKMLKERQIDVLYVCLPPFAHDGQVEAAAKKGIHLFLEKPIARTVKRGQSMVRAIEKAGVVSQVGFHMRFAAPVQKLKQLIDSGTAGLPTLMQGRYFCNALHAPWWRDAEKCGGQVFEQIIHLYDMATFLLGEPGAVVAFADNLCHKSVEGYSVEDTSAGLIRFRTGAMATIAASNCAVPTQWVGDFRVVCQNVTADFANLDNASFTYSDGKPAEFYFSSGQQPKTEQVAQPVDCYLEETKNFIAAVRGEAKALTPARQGLEALKLVTAVMESAKDHGRVVRL